MKSFNAFLSEAYARILAGGAKVLGTGKAKSIASKKLVAGARTQIPKGKAAVSAKSGLGKKRYSNQSILSDLSKAYGKKGKTTGKKKVHPRLDRKRAALQAKSDDADKRMKAGAQGTRVHSSGSQFGKSVGMGSGLSAVTSNLRKQAGSAHKPAEPRDVRRKFRQGGIKLRKAGGAVSQELNKKGGVVRNIKAAGLKTMRKLNNEYEPELMDWRESFIMEVDKKYPSGVKEKIIDVMKGKNTIEVMPDEPDDKYSKGT
tara:strand:- start:904 stop:1677 length:774 start_codon:yes stop_codon:yes gene_type:complete